MNDLPQIDPTKITESVSKKLSVSISDLMVQVVTLELLATALRDERDKERTTVNELKQELVELRESSTPLVGDVV